MNELLAGMTDDALVASLRELAVRSRWVEADIVEHLMVVEERGLHLGMAYPSLFAFCTHGLGFSEGAAYNRIEVARAARRLPALLARLRDGDVHLTGLRLLAPHLTEENHISVLARAKGGTKTRIAEIVAELAPKVPVVDSVRRLPESARLPRPGSVVPQGPAMTRPAPAAPTPTPTPAAAAAQMGPLAVAAPQTWPGPAAVPQMGPGAVAVPQMGPGTVAAPQMELGAVARREVRVEAPVARTYAVSFTASEALKDKLREAQGLLRHQVPAGDLATIVERALDLLIATTRKERFGVGAKPRQSVTPRAASRHVPAEVRRRVYERDGGRCAFVSAEGRRCEETGGLEIDHLDGFARTAVHDAERMRLVCRSHNQHAADLLYGRGFMAQARARARSGTSTRSSEHASST